jgi:hypothetical protein
MSIRVIDILNDCQKLIQASKEMGLQRIARISSIPVESVELVADALEKQIQKKPVKRSFVIPYPGIYVCPKCKEALNRQEHHCRCGQAIKWEEGDEK